MKKLFLLCSIVALQFALSAQAGTGIFGSFARLNVNGSEAWYGCDEFGNNPPDFNGLSIGTFNPSQGHSLTLSGFELETWKDGTGDVTGAYLYYRIWSGSESGAFTQVNGYWQANAPFTAADGSSAGNDGDQKWGNYGLNIDVLNGLANGDYTLEIYYKATTNEGDRYSNGGVGEPNFEATFSVVPEPTTASLLALAGLAAVIRRRRA